MATPTVADFAYRAGDTVDETFTLLDGVGAPFDFTGYTISADLKERDVTDDSPVIASFGVYDVAPGTFRLKLAADDTNLVGTFTYDAQIVAPDGTIATLFAGVIVFDQQVTR